MEMVDNILQVSPRPTTTLSRQAQATLDNYNKLIILDHFLQPPDSSDIICDNWGEPEQAPHICSVCEFCLSTYLRLSVCLYLCLSIGIYVRNTIINKFNTNLRRTYCSLKTYFVSQHLKLCA